MTPNKQLIFETREEARIYFFQNYYICGVADEEDVDEQFTQWLSEQNVIIKSEVKK